MRKNEINAYRRDMIKAKYAYHQAIAEKLKECGKELEVVSEYWDKDDDYPKGVELTNLGDDNNAFNVVVNRIRYENGEPSFHVCRWEYTEVDYWVTTGDLTEECVDYIYDSIIWEDEETPEDENKLDERLRLTDDQKAAVNHYNNAVHELLNSGVHCVFREFDEIAVFNGKEVEHETFEEEDGDDYMTIDFENFPTIECPFGLNLCCNDRAVKIQMKEE